jgi:hypothetical protein
MSVGKSLRSAALDVSFATDKATVCALRKALRQWRGEFRRGVGSASDRQQIVCPQGRVVAIPDPDAGHDRLLSGVPCRAPTANPW